MPKTVIWVRWVGQEVTLLSSIFICSNPHILISYRVHLLDVSPIPKHRDFPFYIHAKAVGSHSFHVSHCRAEELEVQSVCHLLACSRLWALTSRPEKKIMNKCSFKTLINVYPVCSSLPKVGNILMSGVASAREK